MPLPELVLAVAAAMDRDALRRDGEAGIALRGFSIWLRALARAEVGGVEDQSERIRELEQALRPFAEVGRILLPQDEFDDSCWTKMKDDDLVCQYYLLATVGDCRRAARALIEGKEHDWEFVAGCVGVVRCRACGFVQESGKVEGFCEGGM